jgi:hypothetical protein
LGEGQEIDALGEKSCQQCIGSGHVAQSPAEHQVYSVFGGGVDQRLDLAINLHRDYPTHRIGVPLQCSALIRAQRI